MKAAKTWEVSEIAIRCQAHPQNGLLDTSYDNEAGIALVKPCHSCLGRPTVKPTLTFATAKPYEAKKKW